MKKFFTLLSLLLLGGGVSAQGVTCATGFPDVIFSSEMEDNTGWTGNIGTGNAEWDFPTSAPGGNSSSTGPSGAHSGSSYAEFEGSGNYGTIGEMTSPMIDLSGVSNAAELTFFWHAYGTNIGTCNVGIGTSATGPFTTEFTQTGAFQTSAGQAWEQAIVDLTPYIGQQIWINFSYASAGSSFYGDFAIDLVEVEGCVSCPQPANLAVSNITSTGMDIDWTSIGPNDFEIEWGPSPYVPGGANQTGSATISGATAPFTYQISNLSAATTYDVYVSADCGASGASNWTSETVTTDFQAPQGVSCGTGFQTVIFESEMEDNTDWTGDISTASGAWDFPTVAPGGNSIGTGPSAPASGTSYAEFEASGNYGQVGNMITPMIDLSQSSSEAELSFYLHAFGGNIGTLDVGVSTSATGPFTTVFTSTGEIQTSETQAWEHIGVDLSAYLGQQIYIQFSHASTGSSFYGDVAIDLVKVESCVSCPSPLNFGVNGSDFASVDLGWDEAGNAVEWEVVYGSVGTPANSMTNVTSFTDATGNYNLPSVEDSITSLNTNETFDIYVRAVCGPNDSSIFVGPLIANTYGQGSYMVSDVDCGPGFVDIESYGTQHVLGADGELGFTLPFTILHQGYEYNDATIGGNGAMYLGSNNFQVAPVNTILNNTSEFGFYPLWDDYEGELDPEDGVYTHTEGTAPNRTFIVQWNFDHDFSNGTDIIFQMQIEEATFETYFLYGNTTVASTFYSNGNSATIGVVGANQILQESYNNSTFLENNSCLKYYYTNCPRVNNLDVTTYETNMIGLTWDAGISGETNWTIEYGPSGFTPGNGTTVTTTNPYDTISTGITHITDYDIYVYADCGTANQSNGVMVQHQTAPLCANPFGISPNSLEDSLGVTWNWQTNGSGLLPVDFNISYTWSGSDVYDGDIVQVGGSSFHDTILNPNVIPSGVYDLYVQTVCNNGDTSAYVGPIPFIGFMDNDTVCNAPELQVDGTVYPLNNTGAGVEPGAQGIAPPVTGYNTTDGWGNGTMYKTNWYTFVVPQSGDVIISGTDENYDGKMAVYTSSTCSDYNQFNLVSANDDGVVFGNTPAPEWTVCGLTPGETVYLVHSAEFNSTSNGLFTIKLEELDFEAGTANPVVDVCIGDTADLYTTITGYETQYGSWTDLQSTNQMINGDQFLTGVLASQVYDFEYRVQLGCSYDSIIGQLEIWSRSNAGDDGSIEVCLNQPVNLEQGLQGSTIIGGDWYDPTDNLVGESLPSSGNIPGQFNYDYVVGNGVCPDDTALVVLNVLGNCDYLGLDENRIEGISVFPNPATDVVNINSLGSHDELEVKVYDLNGRIVLSSEKGLKEGSSLKLNTSYLETGVYMIKLSNSNVNNTYRLIVK